jgi:hypothetical protein
MQRTVSSASRTQHFDDDSESDYDDVSIEQLQAACVKKINSCGDADKLRNCLQALAGADAMRDTTVGTPNASRTPDDDDALVVAKNSEERKLVKFAERQQILYRFAATPATMIRGYRAAKASDPNMTVAKFTAG